MVKTMRAFFCLLITLTSLAAATGSPAAEPYVVGDRFDAFTIRDQHEVIYTLTPEVRTVIAAFTMPVAKTTNRYLEKQPANFLPSNHAVFVANIYGMPSVGRFFALPKMRNYPHRIFLADAEHFFDRYPQQDGKLTVFRLDSSALITSIDFVEPEKGLPSVFNAAK
jgi:hypothetical protein